MTLTDEMIDKGWKVTRTFWLVKTRRYRNEFARDVVWDGCVDSFLKAIEKYDGRVPFERYVLFLLWRNWSQAQRWLRRVGRRIFDTERLGEKRARKLSGRPDGAIDRIDGLDLLAARGRSVCREWLAILWRWLEGEREIDIAYSLGVSRAVVNWRVKRAIEMVADGS